MKLSLLSESVEVKLTLRKTKNQYDNDVQGIFANLNGKKILVGYFEKGTDEADPYSKISAGKVNIVYINWEEKGLTKLFGEKIKVSSHNGDIYDSQARPSMAKWNAYVALERLAEKMNKDFKFVGFR